MTILPFDHPRGHTAGLLRLAARAPGLSFGDRACLALAAPQGRARWRS